VTVANVRGNTIEYMDTAEAIRQRHVDLQQVGWYESLGLCFGRQPQPPKFEFSHLLKAPERHL